MFITSRFSGTLLQLAGVMKLVNMRDSKSRAARLEGSSPSSGTKKADREVGFRLPEVTQDLCQQILRVGLKRLPGIL